MAEALTVENYEQAERDIFRLTGLPDESFEFKNVKVGEHKWEDVTMRTVIVTHSKGDEATEDKPILVFVHGYSSSSGHYYNIVKRISKYFRMILIDQIGFGLSSRPLNCDKSKFTGKDYINYFVNYLEAWRVAMGLNDKFYLVGHSMGAYLCGNYAVQHQDKLLKVLLLSPAGVAEAGSNPDPY